MTQTPTIRRLAASAVLLTTLVLGACGGDSGSGAEPAKTAEPAAKAGVGTAVEIVDFNFKPDDLEVPAGTTVTFTNKDGFAHTVTAKDKSFDSGNLDQDGTFDQTFAEAGTYEYFCAIHNSMTGKVVVK
jgi:plastocyanin